MSQADEIRRMAEHARATCRDEIADALDRAAAACDEADRLHEISRMHAAAAIHHMDQAQAYARDAARLAGADD